MTDQLNYTAARLTSLHLTFAGSHLKVQTIPDAALNNFLNIKSEVWRKINGISLELDKFDFNQEDLDNLGYIFSNINPINTFQLRVKRSNNVPEDRFIQLFPQASPHLEWLSGIDLDFTGSELSDNHIICLDELVFSKMIYLKSFGLDLYDTKVTTASISKFAKNSFHCMTKLTELKLDLGCTKIDSSGFEQLFENIPTKVMCLELKLNDTKIQHEALQRLAEKINTLKKINEITLGLRNLKLKDEIIYELFCCFPAYIMSLKVNIKCNEDISFEVLMELKDQTNKLFPNLRKFCLELDTLIAKQIEILEVGRPIG